MLKTRIQNALWGAFIADSLGMPSHWFYRRESLEAAFPDGIQGYQAPPHPHPESFLVGVRYQPDVEKARALGRPYDILHEHSRFYRTSYSEFDFPMDSREAAHGNRVAAEAVRYHYHHGLEAGDNTLGADLLRVLIRSVVQRGGYSQSGFIEDFIAFMTGPGNIRDPYRETYLRSWFQNYAAGVAPEHCAQQQRERWSIASHGGAVRPLALAMLNADHPALGLGMAVTHQQLTHGAEMVSALLAVAVPMLGEILQGRSFGEALSRYAGWVRRPAVSGEELGARYREAKGPGNIPHETMWRLHMAYDGPARELLEPDAPMPAEGEYALACYPEHGLPLLLNIGRLHENDLRQALLANANLGGDTVHRGMLLGMLLGAATDTIDPELRQGLREHQALAREIEAFAEVAAAGEGHCVV